MRDDLLDALDSFDRAVAACAAVPGLLPDDAAAVGPRLRRRLGLTDRTVVVAIAGGTGSGKSSLLNALAGRDLAATGPRRPTTERAMVALPDESEAGLIVMLDQLGIDRSVTAGLPERLALIDLPDTDSTVEEHRRVVEGLFPHLDLVIWVVDPEKYHDRVWHEQWLRPYSHLHERFRFVLNQADRLSPDEVTDITVDLTAVLEEDGIPSPRVVITAADPPLGPPVGADVLLDEFDRVAQAKDTALERMRVDLDAVAKDLVTATTFDSSGWDGAVASAATDLASGHTAEAGAVLHGWAADQVPTLPELEGVDSAWDGKVGELAPPPRRWWQRRRRITPAAVKEMAASLERSLGPEVRSRLRPRAAARAAVAELQIALLRLAPGDSASAGDDHPEGAG
jgi:hypothetical protein